MRKHLFVKQSKLLFLLAGLLLGTAPYLWADHLFDPAPNDASETVISTPSSEDPPYNERHYKLRDRHGEEINMADMEDKVVFINFWATWCPPCIAEMPNINKLYQQYKEDESVVFLMISLDQDFEKAKAFVDKRDLDFNIYEPRSRMPNEFQTQGIPVTYVLDKAGEIAYKHVGMGNYNTQKFKDFLEELKAK